MGEIRTDINGNAISPKTASTTAQTIKFGTPRPNKLYIQNEDNTSVIFVTKTENTYNITDATADQGIRIEPGTMFILESSSKFGGFYGISYIADTGTPTITIGAVGE